MVKPLRKQDIGAKAAGDAKKEPMLPNKLKEATRKAKENIEKLFGQGSTKVQLFEVNAKRLEDNSAYAQFNGVMSLVCNFEDCLPAIEPLMQILDEHEDPSMRYAAATRRETKKD